MDRKTSGKFDSCATGSGTSAHPVRIDAFRIEDMCCPTEEKLVRNVLAPLPGVENVEVDTLARTVRIAHRYANARPVETALAKTGMRATREVSPNDRSIVLHVSQMDCPTEEGLIRRRLASEPGVERVEFDLVQRLLRIDAHGQDASHFVKALKDVGFEAELRTGDVPHETKEQNFWRSRETLLLVASGILAVAAELTGWFGAPIAAVAALSVAAVACAGLDTYRKGWIAVKARTLNMNALMAIAATGAMLIGQWPEAAMVMFLFAVAEEIEAKSLDKARDAVRRLIQLAPDRVAIRQPDGTWREMNAKDVSAGAIARVLPGQSIALDGIVVVGSSTVNQAAITGESIPVEKTTGDPVFAGTVNEVGAFQYRVTSVATETTLARIVQAVEQAQSKRARTQRFVDEFAKWYTPAVFIAAVALGTLAPVAFGWTWHDAIYRALVLLVIACPCALVIATPVTIVTGLTAAARHGILVKGGVYLEMGHKLRILALDKTGTVTRGRPGLTDFIELSADPAASAREVAFALASHSDHPVSRAIALALRGTPAIEIAGFEALPGRGTRAIVAGTEYFLGNERLVQEVGASVENIRAQLGKLEQSGKTALMLTTRQAVIAVIGVADTIKPESRTAIAGLQRDGVRVVMLSGDNEATTTAVARQAGIKEAWGGQLPQDKLRYVERFVEEASSSDAKVGMVGDGINDAPALARADIGFAMGAAGSDTAIEVADVALMDDDLRKIPAFLQLSRRTVTILWQNIALATGIKAVFLVLALAGHATMWMAVFADMGASLIVVFNGLRVSRGFNASAAITTHSR
ncbi:cation-translocating P-type ATPase [Paraburkholderia sartisoli]|nr:heavy metal translocating P-type ATPase [Paraburkholderia sartisoli]